jgi:hypothetical protein
MQSQAVLGFASFDGTVNLNKYLNLPHVIEIYGFFWLRKIWRSYFEIVAEIFWSRGVEATVIFAARCAE